LTAIVLNLLSVGAAYGVLVWVFQDGHLEGLLRFHSNGAVVTWLPLFLFAVLFGLSMDYHVFIVSRIKELVDRGLLLPASMKLLGAWNWYLPRWLDWMPRLRSEPQRGMALTELG
jgi:uncharacterized membrane protein YdfJ with MMPL/SSD domain